MTNETNRILLVTTDSIPLVGGIADYLDNLVSATTQAIDWSVYSTVPACSSFDQEVPYRIHRWPETRKLGDKFGDDIFLLRRWNTFRWFCQRPAIAYEQIAQAIRDNQPELVLIGRWCTEGHFWCRALRRQNQKYALFAYGMELEEPTEAHPLTRFLTGPRESDRRKDFVLAERVFSISDTTTSRLCAMGVALDKIVKLTPGVDPDKLQLLSETACRNELERLGVTGKFILAMGRLVRRKGFDLGVQAFADIVPEFSEIDFIIAGEGPARDEIESAIHARNLDTRVRLTGEVTTLQKRALYQACEYFVMPNRPLPGDMEGFGIVFLEANLFAKAVIGGDNGGVPDAVADGVSGLLVATDKDHRLLADAMRRLLAESGFRTRMGRDGRERALRMFNWKNLGQRFVENLMTILRSGDHD